MTLTGARERPRVLRVLGEVVGLLAELAHRPLLCCTKDWAALYEVIRSISKIHCQGEESRQSSYPCKVCIRAFTCVQKIPLSPENWRPGRRSG